MVEPVNRITAALARLLLVLLLVSMAGGAATADAPPRALTLTGVGEVAAAPNMARLSITVEAEAATAREALGRASGLVADVFAVLDSFSITGGDRRTLALSLAPLHERDERGRIVRRVGFRAAQDVEIRVGRLEALGAVLDALVDAGVDAFGGIVFDVGERSSLIDEARRRALAEARRAADLLAAEAGVTLGAPLSIRLEEAGGAAPMGRVAFAEAATSMPVAEGEITIRARVTVEYALE